MLRVGVLRRVPQRSAHRKFKSSEENTVYRSGILKEKVLGKLCSCRSDNHVEL
jgi:hypothetical protein